MMTRVSTPLGSGNGVGFDIPYYLRPSGSRDRRFLVGAIVAAGTLHAVFLILPLPEREAAPPRLPTHNPPTIISCSILPPKIQRQEIARVTHERRVPIPAKRPDELGPVMEPRLETALVPVSREISDPNEWIPADIPQPPTTQPPFPIGPNFTAPVLIEETKVTPEYPPIARVSRREGHVILTAIIEADGTVSDAQIVRVDPPNYGFADAAAEAVLQWQYEPALQRGRPVAVSFTIYVAFTLR